MLNSSCGQSFAEIVFTGNLSAAVEYRQRNHDPRLCLGAETASAIVEAHAYS